MGVGGPVGSGKTALVLALCRLLRDTHSLGVVTNDIFTREDAEFLHPQRGAPAGADPRGGDRRLPARGHPRGRHRQPAGARGAHPSRTTPSCSSASRGGDNLAAHFSRELADFTIYVIDVAGGDKVPRKGGPGITQSDLLVVNKTDLAPAVGADLGVMARDAARMRGDGPVVFAQVTRGEGVAEIAAQVLHALQHAAGLPH